MRGTADIQHAHDTLISVLLQQTSVRLDGHGERLLMEAAGVLCWILHDEDQDHEGSFALDLLRLETELAERGELDEAARRSGSSSEHVWPGTLWADS